MRSIVLGAAAAVLFTTSPASAQYPLITADTYKMNGPSGQPWALGGFDPRMGYWVHGGTPDTPSDQWAVRAWTPVTANGYWLSQPPNTGFYMAYPAVPAYAEGPGATGRCHPCRR